MNTNTLPVDLWVIMPVYNEEATVEAVIHEWMTELRTLDIPFVFCILDDGSSDGSLPILRKAAALYREIRIIQKLNSGHGKTCLMGYQLAIANEAKWVFQLDSDGQCDPRYFKQMWDCREQYNAVYGMRAQREDGYFRYFISRVLSLGAFLATRIWVSDANVPYRLMKTKTLEEVVGVIPKDIDLVNVFVTLHQQQYGSLHWVDIGFRSRLGGTPSRQVLLIAIRGLQLLRQLFRHRALFWKR